jgi:hypothetical protein
MPVLSKETLQRLATLYAVSNWGDSGAFGELRVQKTLFFADKNSGERHILTFKKWDYGQYSEDVASSLNAIRAAGRLELEFGGQAIRIYSMIGPQAMRLIAKVLKCNFSNWFVEFGKAFSEWAYLPNEELLDRAHRDPSFTENQRGDVIFASSIPDTIELTDITDDEAEQLADLVDPVLNLRIHRGVERALMLDDQIPDWRKVLDG